MDAITCMHLVEHLRDPSLLVAEIARLLKPGGRVYFETPHPKTLTLPSLRDAPGGGFTMNFHDDPTHFRLVSVNELAEPFDMSLPAISRHLKVLEQAGLITRGRDAQFRPCHLEPEPLRDVAGWLEQYRKFWDESLNRLEDYLRTLQTKEQTNDDNA